MMKRNSQICNILNYNNSNNPIKIYPMTAKNIKISFFDFLYSSHKEIHLLVSNKLINSLEYNSKVILCNMQKYLKL
jgi:hypothetical protein